MTPDAPAAAPKKNSHMLLGIVAVITIAGLAAAALFIAHERRYVYTDKAEIEAPLISLGPKEPGILKHVYVDVGDVVRASQTVAWVGDESINAQVDGLIVEAQGDLGAHYQPGQGVVTMIQPKELRVVARIDEDKGLKDIFVGQNALFTLDAYGSREFTGTVESVSPTKRSGDVVFNISDKRETKQFDVKITYDEPDNAWFHNGMSARVWIVK